MRRVPLFDLGMHPTCMECKRFKGAKNPFIKGFGNGLSRIMFVIDGITANDDERGKLLSGTTGTALHKALKNMGYDLYRDFWVTAATKCYAKVKIKPKHCHACRELLLDELKEARPVGETSILYKDTDENPKGIVVFGSEALRTICKGALEEYNATAIAGEVFPYNGMWVGVMHSTETMIKNWHDKNYQSWFYRVMNYILHKIDDSNRIPEVPNPYEYIEPILDFQQLKAVLRDIYRSKDGCSIDYETSGINIHYPGHHIWSMSIAPLEQNISYAFAIDHPQGWSKSQQQGLHDIMGHMFKKPRYWVAQNMQFEKPWTRGIFGVDPNFGWCTMIGSHLENTTKGRTGLKLQGLIKYGIHGYGDESEHYKKAPKGEEFNRMHEMELESQLFYCGIDSWLTSKLWHTQQETLADRIKAAKFFMKGANVLTDLTWNGINIDLRYYADARKTLTKEIDKITADVMNSDEMQGYLQANGYPFFNLSSDKDIRSFLIDYLHLRQWKMTASGKNVSVDKEALEKMEHWIPTKVIELRHLKKIRDTYINQYETVHTREMLHPNYTLHIASSLRSTCVAKGTGIMLVGYKNTIPIENVKIGDQVFCYDKDKNLVIRSVKWSGKTGHKKIIRLHWETGVGKNLRTGYLDVTPEHQIRLINGNYIRADQALFLPTLALSRGRGTRKDELRVSGISNHIFEHRFIYEQLVGALSNDEIVHHKNNDHYDNRPDNLEAMQQNEHVRLHFLGKKKSKAQIKKQKNTFNKSFKDGKIKKIRGLNNHTSINLSKIDCLRILLSCNGKITKVKDVIGIDFNTFKKYCKIFNINIRKINLRFTIQGEFFSLNKLKKWHKLGRAVIMNNTGQNFYKTKELCKIHNLNLDRKWSNQFGKFVPNNHIITAIEELDKTVDVYDLEIEKEHNFIANEICVHNSIGPNFQNVPKHEDKAKRICRGGIRPRPGRLFIEADFSGIEVVTSCLYHHDPTFTNYQLDPTTDMHRDNAADLWCTTPDNISKKVRAFQKNTWTFPQFYGDYYGNCAKNTWEGRNLKLKDGRTCLESLYDAGIMDLDSYTDYLEEAERILWEDRFPVFTQWKWDQCRDYQSRGFIDTYLGFIYNGCLNRKQLGNYPIQGTAFHILLWCLIYIHGIAKREGWESTFISEIHDSMILDVVPHEITHIIKTIKHVCEKVVVDRFDWITLPFEVDIECSKINGSFADFYEIKLNKEEKPTIIVPGKRDEDDTIITIYSEVDWEQWTEPDWRKAV